MKQNAVFTDYDESQTAHLRNILYWTAMLTTLMACGFLVSALWTGHSQLFIYAIVTWVISTVFWAGSRLLSTKNLVATVLGVVFMLFVIGWMMLTQLYESILISSLYPIIATSIAATCLRGRWLLAVSLTTMAASAVANSYVLFSDPADTVVVISRVVIVIGVMATQFSGSLYILRTRRRIINSLEELQHAHGALQEAQTTLENQVACRTNELANSVAVLQATFEAAADGIAVFDSNGRLAMWNRKFLDIWQVPDDVGAGSRQHTIRAILGQVQDRHAFVTQLRAIHSRPDNASRTMVVLKHGRVIDCASQPQYVEGHGKGRVWSFRDITDIRRSQQQSAAFAALGQQLSAATSAIEACRIIIRVADELLRWDACFINLYDAKNDMVDCLFDIDLVNGVRREADTKGKRIRPTPMLRRTIVEGAQLVLRNTAPAPNTMPLVPFGDMQRSSESLMFVPIRHGSNVIGIFSVQSYTVNAFTMDHLRMLQDLADHCGGALERIYTEEELRKAQDERRLLEVRMVEAQKYESLGVLASGFAHDFNNILTIMQGNVGLAQMLVPWPHPANEHLQHVEQAAQRAADLISQIMAYTGKSQHFAQPLVLNDLVHDVSQLLSPTFSPSVGIQFELAATLPSIYGDAVQLRQVLMHVLMNAYESFDSDFGTITVSTQLLELTYEIQQQTPAYAKLMPGSYTTLRVADTGCGIGAETIDRIFEPFFSTKVMGRGLGLAAVLGIVRRHAGAIHVESVPGQGTVFEIILPVHNVAVQRLARAYSPDHAAR